MTSKKQHIICPDDNELAMFIEGTLSEEREDYILQHLDMCEECAEVVRLAVDYQAFSKEEETDGDSDTGNAGKAGLGLLAGGAVFGKLVDNILGHAHGVPRVAGKNSDTDERNTEVGNSNEVDNQ